MLAIIILSLVVIFISLLCWKQQMEIKDYEFFITWILKDDIDTKDKMEWINNLKRSFRKNGKF